MNAALRSLDLFTSYANFCAGLLLFSISSVVTSIWRIWRQPLISGTILSLARFQPLVDGFVLYHHGALPASPPMVEGGIWSFQDGKHVAKHIVFTAFRHWRAISKS